MRKKLLIIGFGYTAQHLATLLTQNQYTISATIRGKPPEKNPHLKHVKLIPFSQDSICQAIKTASHILISTPPNSNGIDPCFDLIRTQLIKFQSTLKWVGYLSSTGVYGNHHGQWVDENSDLNTTRESGLRRIKAENNWLSLFNEYDIPLHIFRLAAIYGPKRNNLIRVHKGKSQSITKENHVFSRVHVEDLSRALCRSMITPTPGEIYNLADDQPCAAEEIDALTTKLLKRPNLPKIAFEKASISEPLKAFYQDNKRVSNRKFKHYFKFEFRYPSYIEGLTSLHVSFDSSDEL